MVNRRNWTIIWPLVLLISDVVTINGSFILAYWLRFYSRLITIRDIPPLEAYINALIVLNFIWLIIFKSYGLYRERLTVSWIEEAFSVIKGISLGSLIAMAITFMYRGFSYSRIVVGLAWLISIVLVSLSRYAIRGIQRQYRKRGIGINRVLIVGSGEMGRFIKRKVEENPAWGYELVGVAIEEKGKTEKSILGLKVLGTIKKLPSIIKEEKIDEVIITLPSSRHKEILDIVMECENEGVRVKIVSDLLGIMASPVTTDEILGIPVLGIKESPLQGWNIVVKRMMDIVLSLAALLLVSPLMVIVVILIKVTSEGPVLYKQERVGQDGKVFTMYKFRSMRVDAERETGPVWAIRNDPRRTKIGALLRKFSLDELPQLLNVLKGDMSLVGPRPERPYFVNKFNKTIARYMKRHRVKSGITGWAQVNGLRGNTPIEERTKYDLYYVENWSLWLDLKILVKTILEFWTQREAY